MPNHWLSLAALGAIACSGGGSSQDGGSASEDATPEGDGGGSSTDSGPLGDASTASPCENLPLAAGNDALGTATELPGEGISPVVAFDGTSGVVVWRIPLENDLVDIVALRLDSEGAPIGNTPIPIASGASSNNGTHGHSNHNNHFTAVAANDGTVLIAWATGAEFNAEIRARTLSAAGELGDEFIVQELITSDGAITFQSKAKNPRVVAVGDHFVVAWTFRGASASPPTILRARQYDLNGQAFDSMLQPSGSVDSVSVPGGLAIGTNGSEAFFSWPVSDGPASEKYIGRIANADWETGAKL